MIDAKGFAIRSIKLVDILKGSMETKWKSALKLQVSFGPGGHIKNEDKPFELAEKLSIIAKRLRGIVDQCADSESNRDSCNDRYEKE